MNQRAVVGRMFFCDCDSHVWMITAFLLKLVRFQIQCTNLSILYYISSFSLKNIVFSKTCFYWLVNCYYLSSLESVFFTLDIAWKFSIVDNFKLQTVLPRKLSGPNSRNFQTPSFWLSFSTWKAPYWLFTSKIWSLTRSFQILSALIYHLKKLQLRRTYSAIFEH